MPCSEGQKRIKSNRMTNLRAIIPDAYSQRYHALSIAASLNLDYKKPEDVIAAAKKLEAYLSGEKK
jgi:hypothetical protein